MREMMGEEKIEDNRDEKRAERSETGGERREENREQRDVRKEKGEMKRRGEENKPRPWSGPKPCPRFRPWSKP